MKSKSFIIGYFHECDSGDDYCAQIEDFRRAHGGFILLATEDTQIWAFPDDGTQEELEKYWKEWIGYSYRTTHFEWVRNPVEWQRSWSNKFQAMLQSSLEVYLS
jgi:hypothetical protein